VSERLKRIAQAASLVMGAYVASRVLGVAREMIIARQFGTSAELGSYLAAFRVPDFIFQLLAGGALGSSLIPVLSTFLARDDHRGAWRLASAIYNWVALLTTLSAVLAFILSPELTRLLVPGFTPEMQQLTQRLMRIMLITPIIFGVSGITMAVLNAHQHFLLPALAPIVYNLSIIGGALGLAPQLGVYGLAIGVAVGALLHLTIQVPGLLRQRSTWIPTLGLGSAAVGQVIKLLLPRMLGLAVMQANFVVSVRLASGLGSGSLPALNYAFLLMMLPQGIFAMALATAAFPAFSELVARAQMDTLRDTLTTMLRAMLLLAVPAAVGLFLLRKPIIQILLEGGRFTNTSTLAVAGALQFYLLGLPAYAVVEILSRAFYALHDTWTPVITAAATVALNIVLSLALIAPLEIGGLALANALAVNIEMACLLWFIRRRVRGINGSALFGAILRILIASLCMGGILWGLLRGLADYPAWQIAMAGIALGGIAYGGLLWLLGLEEARVAVDWLLRRLRHILNQAWQEA
jgi:putative peptidoglycan lipid II flippase